MSDLLELMSINNFQCSTLDHPDKLIVSLVLGQTVRKLVLNKDLSILRWRGITQAAYMTHDSSLRIKACDIESYDEHITRDDLT